MICRKCGTHMGDTDKFCPSCGEPQFKPAPKFNIDSAIQIIFFISIMLVISRFLSPAMAWLLPVAILVWLYRTISKK